MNLIKEIKEWWSEERHYYIDPDNNDCMVDNMEWLIQRVEELYNALSCAKDIIDGDLGTHDYDGAVEVINKALEDTQ